MLSRARVHLTVEESFHPGFKQATRPVSPPRDVFWFISPSAVSRRLRTSSHSEISAGQRHFRSAPSVVISSQQSYLYKKNIFCVTILLNSLYLYVYIHLIQSVGWLLDLIFSVSLIVWIFFRFDWQWIILKKSHFDCNTAFNLQSN